MWGPCLGGVLPTEELCNELDDDCDGLFDEDFALGQLCDGPDSDFCSDDIMTCQGCSDGEDNVEVCDCRDNNCDGVIDEGCENSLCEVILTVGEIDRGGCWIDAPPEGSMYLLSFPCGVGDSVEFSFGDVTFFGETRGCTIDLQAQTFFDWSDGCIWETEQHITGDLREAMLSYHYNEWPMEGQVGCDPTCEATGVILVEWADS